MSVFLHTRARGAGVLHRLGELGSTTLPTQETADRWLIALRWVAVLGMLATSLLAKRLVPELRLDRLLAVLTGIGTLNFGWHILAARRIGKPPMVSLQVAIDVVALTIMLWYSGGTANPFAAFLSFHIVLAGLLCGGRVSVVIAALTLAAVAVLGFATPLPLASAPLGAAEVQRIGHIVSLVTLSAFIGFFVYMYVRRVDELRAEGARNEKAAVLGRLVGAMSHELNTPLATILLASKDLVLLGKEAESAEIARLAETIVDEVERASQVIGLVRGHVKPDQHVEPVELAGFVRELVARELGRLGFTGARSVELDAPAQALVLRAGLSQALSNVLTNAVQAVAATDEPHIEVSLRRRRGWYELVVRDNGPGISPSLLMRVGEPFQTTKAESGGMGLGLYVSSMLAERMGGSLAVENGRRTGTQVTLRMRAA